MKAIKKIILTIILSLIIIPINVSNLSAKSYYHMSKYEERLIQRIAYLEAGNHGVKGMGYVMQTIINRKHSKEFPNTVRKVIFERGQFTTARYVNKGHINKYTKRALKNLKKGKYKRMKALYFCERSYRAKSSWFMSLNLVMFYKSHAYMK